MKAMVKALLPAMIFLGSLKGMAQNNSFPMPCPLNEATVVPPPKNAVKFDEPDLCIVLMSMPDSVVKSVGTGRITNTENTEESGYGVVLFAKVNGKEYYFWYTGMNKLLVKRNDVVQPG
ncbi:MAG: M23 family metallopeptidase [Bacteroidetes bacterium]|nr:M23 family metallopeptidase [Bacteroidota bacterium]